MGVNATLPDPAVAFEWPLGATDTMVVAMVMVVVYGYLGRFWHQTKDLRSASSLKSGRADGQANREQRERDTSNVSSEPNASSARTSIVEAMRNSDRNCVVVFGSQTGTAEAFATRLAQDGRSSWSLRTMTADADEYTWIDLDKVDSSHVLIFVLATYGEGEPTDNAVTLYETLTRAAARVDGQPLTNLSYAAFGLGNKTYENYNNVVHSVDSALQQLGAQRICPVGEGDDAAGTIEEDFLSWKTIMWKEVSALLGLHERKAVYEPVLEVLQRGDLSPQSPGVYLGEMSVQQLKGLPTTGGPQQLFISRITEARELFRMKDRNCVHMEFDLTGSGISYQTGDHVAIHPMNPNAEVDRFLRIHGLLDMRNHVIDIRSLEAIEKVPCPSPTTYESIARYYLEISAPMSRQLAARLVPFAPTSEAAAMMVRLSNDVEYFAKTVTSNYMNLPQVLEFSGGGSVWNTVPFSLYLECLSRLRPRYYSISSSSLVHPQSLSITAVAEKALLPSGDTWKGVASNYLLDLKREHFGEAGTQPEYAIQGPRDKYAGFRLPLHIRQSKFRLPEDPSVPIIMVGPGTGVAPFRAFLQERTAQLQAGQKVGTSMLFYGCRSRTQDFLYEEDLATFKSVLGDSFSLITAFSREGGKKIYVQHRLSENGEEVADLLAQGGYFYVCGDAAGMAADVHNTFAGILAKRRGGSKQAGLDELKQLRAWSRYQEDTW